MSKSRDKTAPAARNSAPDASGAADGQTLARAAARACDQKRAEDVLLLDLRGLSDVTDFFVIASAASASQRKGIAGAVEKALKEAGARRIHRAAPREGRWTLLDYGEVVIHLFDTEARQFYQLEELWGDAPRLPFHGTD